MLLSKPLFFSFTSINNNYILCNNNTKKSKMDVVDDVAPSASPSASESIAVYDNSLLRGESSVVHQQRCWKHLGMASSWNQRGIHLIRAIIVESMGFWTTRYGLGRLFVVVAKCSLRHVFEGKLNWFLKQGKHVLKHVLVLFSRRFHENSLENKFFEF